jgi:hypothetical protein
MKWHFKFKNRETGFSDREPVFSDRETGHSDRELKKTGVVKPNFTKK